MTHESILVILLLPFYKNSSCGYAGKVEIVNLLILNC
ncbi:hypothetical protein KSS87_012455 [Heliosperma pusillum]|nr:hypothetical protein KSS87_000177 [Heliosperma pusillum]KAH9613884.1 hypothetical protein KSS87_012455 [Heliosperma pusillum]